MIFPKSENRKADWFFGSAFLFFTLKYQNTFLNLYAKWKVKN